MYELLVNGMRKFVYVIVKFLMLDVLYKVKNCKDFDFFFKKIKRYIFFN